MICHTKCTINKLRMNSNTEGKNFQIRPIAIKKSNIDICSGFCYNKDNDFI